MDRLPAELWFRIFGLLDHPNLATALQDAGCQPVCRRWNNLASDDTLWSKLFQDRWGSNAMELFSPIDPPVSSSSSSKSWKEVYEVQDRCDRVGLGLKIIREGSDYYIIHQGEIQRCLGSTRKSDGKDKAGEGIRHGLGISDRILFFIADLEKACADAKRIRM